jgi:endonuclease YncB( thermonuclease family)
MNVRTKFAWFYKFPTWAKVLFWILFWPFLILALLFFGIKNRKLRNVLTGVWSLLILIVYVPIVFAAILVPSQRPIPKANVQGINDKVLDVTSIEKNIDEENNKKLESAKAAQIQEINIASAQKVNSNYDVESDIGSQDTGTAVQANLAIASLGNETKNQKLFDVTSVVDGDTIKLSELGTLRLIGIDTPETKDPRKPVQCFGVEASKRASELLSGKKVYLEFDPANRIDKYGRTLAYVYKEDGYFFNAEMIKDGYANSYTKYPHPKLDEFNKFSKEAREKQKGLYSPDTCNGDTSQKAKDTTSTPNQSLPKTTTPKPTIVVTPAPATAPSPAPNTDVYYANCDAVRAAGKAPIYSGQPGYRAGLDRDKDGIGCE